MNKEILVTGSKLLIQIFLTKLLKGTHTTRIRKRYDLPKK